MDVLTFINEGEEKPTVFFNHCDDFVTIGFKVPGRGRIKFLVDRTELNHFAELLTEAKRRIIEVAPLKN